MRPNSQYPASSYGNQSLIASRNRGNAHSKDERLPLLTGYSQIVNWGTGGDVVLVPTEERVLPPLEIGVLPTQ
jgi:hypothetical protein